ncbi:retrovirus-related pol polyprotein from transposon TNT 1-94 [Tanacetum coccineum]
MYQSTECHHRTTSDRSSTSPTPRNSRRNPKSFTDVPHPSHNHGYWEIQMSDDGQNVFFLGLQVSQSPGGIFINQAKYALETLKKYGMDLSDPVDTPMVDRLKLDEDLMGTSS